MAKLLRCNEKKSENFNFQKISIFKKFQYKLFFHMFDFQLTTFPLICTTCPLKQSSPFFYEYMNGISQKGEAW